ncbi:MAG: helix-turn-helix domain-containing protein [Lachnospiraceae bacterium]|nr:helix-turn-helix domain-containing protein [Lachnospiraceae bacterium]
MKIPLGSDQNFPKFLKRIRKEENVYLEQLAEGLMTVSQLARIEKGQRPIPKNLRDRLLGRLGVASDLYENLLNIEDYAAWEHQRNILYAIERRDTKRAQELIAAYEKEAPIHDKIKQQFCLMMTAEVLKQQEIDQCEIAACYRKAVKHTVPDVDDLCLEKKLLSIQEINMILEYEFYHKNVDFAAHCRELLTFVENAVYDDLSKVKVYPKIVYYYLQEIFSGQHQLDSESLEESLKICNQAIEMLRDTGRAFYLLELLEMKIKIVECMNQNLAEDRDSGLGYQDCIDLVKLLKKLSAEYSVPAYMQDCTYLYQQRWVFYIGDVLRIRREMYGLTQKELCQGICSVRTLRRAEKREANMQHAFVGPLLRKLGLSKEFQRSRIVTDDREVLKIKREMLTCRNNRDFIRCRELLNQMRERLSLEIPENRQYMIELEASLDWREGKISKEEFAARELEALQCTLDVKQLIHTKEIYLTEMEMFCICKKMRGIDDSEKERYIEFILHYFTLCEKKGVVSDCISMYEHVIPFTASELGNMKQYQLALKLDKKVVETLLACKRVWAASNTLYDIFWNEEKRQMEDGQSMSEEKRTEYLKQCIILSHFCRQTFHEKFYRNKLY